MSRGPFGRALLQKLVESRQCRLRPDRTSRLRIVMVTARSALAHERVIRTLRRWSLLFDEIHFVGNRRKAPFLVAAAADVYFDDRTEQVEAASHAVAAGLAPLHRSST